jgi:H+-transporting ATPase
MEPSEKVVESITIDVPNEPENGEGGGEKPKRVRQLSDAAKVFMEPERVHPTTRTRQVSASDVLRKMNDPAILMDGADLKLAEKVAERGTESFRGKEEIIIEEAGLPDDFILNFDGLTSEEAEELLKLYGPNCLPEKVTPKWLIFLQQLTPPMPIMIWLAIIIELAIQNWIDAGILIFIQFANASISFYETTKAADAVAALKSSLKPTATVKRDGKWQVINGNNLVPGDMVLLGSGSAIPADCRVNRGEIEVDQSALTGESLPVTFYKNDSCKMGSTVVRGETEATVEFTGANTFFGKTASLLTSTGEHSHLQMMLIKIMIILVVMSLTLCLINFIYLFLNTRNLKESLSYTIVLLVASIPLAIEIVTTTTLSIGSKSLTAHGAIVAQLSAIEQLAGMSILCSDKTGTLTLNEMVLQDDTPTYQKGLNQETVLLYAALAAKWHEPPRDALDRLTLNNVNRALLENYEQLDYMPFDPQVKRTEGTVKDVKTGKTFKTTKGAPHILMKLLPEDAIEVREAVEADVTRLGSTGTRALAVATTNPETGTWEMAGLLTFLDPPRPDTKQTIADARKNGVAVKMITGDHLLIAKNTSIMLDMGDRIFMADKLPMLDMETKKKPENLSRDYGDLCLAADGFAAVFPEHKYLIVECLRELGYTVGMTGDGVNDAPALKRADVGIAVSGATDAARAAADLVLTQPGLSTIIHGIFIAREIFERIQNFISYRVAATLQLLWFFFIATFAFHPSHYTQPPEDQLVGGPWPEFFHMPVLLLMLITLLNDGTLITIGYDIVKANDTPCRWNLPATFVSSATMGIVSFGSSLLLLWMILDSWNPTGLWAKLGMKGVQYGQITTAIYLKVSISDFLTLFCARTGKRAFFSVMPAKMLLGGGVFALSLSSILSIFWPTGALDGIEIEGLQSNMGVFGFVWIFCLVFWFIQDALKILCVRFLLHINFNDVATSGVVILPESTKAMIKQLDEELKSAIATVAKGHH